MRLDTDQRKYTRKYYFQTIQLALHLCMKESPCPAENEDLNLDLPCNVDLFNEVIYHEPFWVLTEHFIKRKKGQQLTFLK